MEIKINNGTWQIVITMQASTPKDIQKKIYEIAETALALIPNKK